MEAILKDIEKYKSEGNEKGLRRVLSEFLAKRDEFYKEAFTKELMYEYCEAIYDALILEMDEEEEDSIELAERAYALISYLIYKTDVIRFEYYKLRFLLLHYFADYFVDTLVTLFLEQFREDRLLEARVLTDECIQKMQIVDLIDLEEMDKITMEADEQITDASNSIEMDFELNDEEIKEAKLMSKVLFTALYQKYK